MSSSLGFTRDTLHAPRRQSTVIAAIKAKPKLDSSTNVTPTSTTPRISLSKRSPKIPKSTGRVDGRRFGCSLFLLVFNLLLLFGHVGVLMFILNSAFRFPLTFFYTRIKSETVQDILCVYDYGRTVFNDSNTYCEDTSFTSSGSHIPPAQCLRALAQNTSTPTLSASDGPLLQAYTLTRFGQGSRTTAQIDDIGRHLSKGALIFIESTTSVAHLLYAIVFARLVQEARSASRKMPVTMWFLTNGGIPIRWVEYALTASVMTAFVANVSNLFEFFGIVGLMFGTFALMFLGFAIESLCASGRIYEPLVLFYIPGLAVFLSSWAPIVESLMTSVFELTCATFATDSFLMCSQPTCLGRDVPIALFSALLFLFFCTFPLILAYKIFVLGGWLSSLQSSRLPALCATLLIACGFVCFLFIGGVIAWVSVFATILYPLFPYHFQRVRTLTPPKERVLVTLLTCEFLYAIASATSKIFLAIFFTINFAGRDW